MEFMPFSKDDCGGKIILEEGRQIQIEMLDALAGFCDQNSLHYFLSGGTLLGAVRHQGYIPWDDDMDVNMPRPDCEKLLQQSKGRIGRFVLAEPDLNGFVTGC